jgi:hypothetical protein
MITASALLLLTTLVPMQDVPAAKDPPAPAGQGQAGQGQADPASPTASAQDAAPLPTETPEAVKKFLQEAEAHLYDPQVAGLKAVEFDLPIELPNFGVVGSAHVAWSSATGENVTVDRSGGKELPPGMPPGMAEGFGRQMALQVLSAMLNKPITPMLEGSVATMDGVEDGMVKVRIHNAEAEKSGLLEQSLFFDDAGLLQRMRTVGEQQGPMGKVSIKQVENFNWRPVKEGSELVIAASQKSHAEMGSMPIDGTTTISYATVGEIVLATQLAITQSSPMGPSSQTIKTQNLKVNGEAVDA